MVQLEQCNCSRPNPRVSMPDDVPLKATTCAPHAHQRGSGQRVVAFTFFEPLPNKRNQAYQTREYFKGVQANLNLIKSSYPDMVMRLYYDIPAKRQSNGSFLIPFNSPLLVHLCQIACREPTLDICDAGKLPNLGNVTLVHPLLWRFLPAMDPQVEVMFSRDLDSRISDREVAAVEEFLNSTATFHVMRDHPAHSSEVMGGTWGAKLNLERSKFFATMKRILKGSNMKRQGGYDQSVMNRHMWPWVRPISMAHDSYLCQRYPSSRPFPTQRVPGPEIGNFVGSVIGHNHTIHAQPSNHCPMACRPALHQDWIYC
eukprot:maker-scaffold288_size220435-snap-gene-0.9 protein:Tk01459 transcript:maker-scaffold288_size220435-snap-gene-0.9-mRNA-1 annotation:"hypothetical protein DAPPUDRAFT_96285"